MEPHRGLKLSDSLRLDSPLAEGGMANAWVADHLVLGTKVVVKFLSPLILHQPHAVERFRAEAQLTSRINSPHVVRIFDLVDADSSPVDGPYMVMERLEGEDLATRLQRVGSLSMADTADIVDQVASALESAHAAHVLHRDVKPENIFLLECDGRVFVKVLDFGVAKDRSERSLELTDVRTTVGTPRYMSPEQMFSARDVDARCDVWSLAVVAYVCLTGAAPFDGGSFAEICLAVHQGSFEPPSKWRPELGPSVDAFFAKALNARISERPPTARALREELRRAIAPPVSADRRGEIPIPLVRRKPPHWLPAYLGTPAFFPRPFARGDGRLRVSS